MMQNALNITIRSVLFGILLIASGCRPKLVADKYAVAAIGEPGKCLYYEIGGGGPGRIDAKVVAVGWDAEHVIVKQKRHSTISYYIIQHTKDYPLAEVEDVVVGPLSYFEFERKRKKLNVSTNLKFTVNYWF